MADSSSRERENTTLLSYTCYFKKEVENIEIGDRCEFHRRSNISTEKLK